ncbi:helix-turn-helix domain-containing protein [Candidatus Borrarchaeum sp.]|uniref:helix-turn-helix domain-containing protein n=1 Tax=Candidatus Borrarchaeum sp. TaxID=2846742 RepID=UPI0034E0C44F
MIKIVSKKIISTISKDQTEKEFYRHSRDKSELQISTEEYLYDLLIHHGPMTRGEIVKLTKLPRTTIYDHLIKLILKDRVIRFSKLGKKPGRPKVYFKALRF